ncbi:MAG: diguanylate cyclase [Gallionella sp.]|nr:diguanylate cyclase [Gallionella sp.]
MILESRAATASLFHGSQQLMTKKRYKSQSPVSALRAYWDGLGIATKLNIPIQIILVIVLSFAHFWVMESIKTDVLDGAKIRAKVSADGLINGMNMLMVTGSISDPENRRLLVKKMGASEDVKELRIVRAKQVQDQFGVGLPEEQARDELDRRAITSKQSQFLFNANRSEPTLRTVVPFIVSTNFRGTNCLLCHHVEVGSVNGAASITIDMSEDFKVIERYKVSLWTGQLVLQVVLFFSIGWLIRRFIQPIKTLQSAMQSMQRSGTMEHFVPIKTKEGVSDEIGELTRSFNRMSETLRNSEKSMRLASLIYQSNADAILVTDENNLIVDVNPAFSRITGYTREEVLGKNPRIMKSGLHDEVFYRKMWDGIVNQGHWQGEIWDKNKGGDTYVKNINIVVLRHGDGAVYRHVAQFSDITEKKEKDQLIHWQANYDPLTNLPNRRLFHDRLGQAIKMAHRTKSPVALLFIDLDHFKEINDNLGHEVGDALLMEAAIRIKSCVRESDTVSRLGGDEFTVVLPDVSDLSQAERIANNIVDEMARAFGFVNDKTDYFISASVGIAIYPDDATTMESLIRCADKAMYMAKSSGRSRCVAHGPSQPD